MCLYKFGSVMNCPGKEYLVQNVFDIIQLVTSLHKSVIPLFIRRLRGIFFPPLPEQVSVITVHSVTAIFGLLVLLSGRENRHHRTVPRPIAKILISDPERIRNLHRSILL
jgi:hypothetical protein